MRVEVECQCLETLHLAHRRDEVEPGTEGVAGAGDDDAADGGVGVGLPDPTGQDPEHVGGQSVAPLGTVEGDRRHRTVALEE